MNYNELADLLYPNIDKTIEDLEAFFDIKYNFFRGILQENIKKTLMFLFLLPI